MAIRRVVTGVDAHGKAAVLSDEPVAPTLDVAALPGYQITELFATKAFPPTAGDALVEPRPWQLVPPVGEVAWRVVVRPPDRPDADEAGMMAASGADEWAAPGGGDNHDGGMHATDTIDLITIVSGAMWLTIGEEVVHLQPGDCLVQVETPHAWHNHGDKDCVYVALAIPTTKGNDR